MSKPSRQGRVNGLLGLSTGMLYHSGGVISILFCAKNAKKSALITGIVFRNDKIRVLIDRSGNTKILTKENKGGNI